MARLTTAGAALETRRLTNRHSANYSLESHHRRHRAVHGVWLTALAPPGSVTAGVYQCGSPIAARRRLELRRFVPAGVEIQVLRITGTKLRPLWSVKDHFVPEFRACPLLQPLAGVVPRLSVLPIR